MIKYIWDFVKRIQIYAFLLFVVMTSSVMATATENTNSSSDSIITIGNEYMASGNPEKAIGEYNLALAEQPENAGLYLQRGIAYGMLKQTSKSMKDLDKCIELDPNIPEAYYSRAKVYDLRNDKDNAIQEYPKATEVKFDYAQAYYSRGVDYFRKGIPDLALADYQSAIRIEPNYFKA